MYKTFAAILLSAACATTAHSAPTSGPTAPATANSTPAQLAAAVAEADRVINAADARDLFVNVTDGTVPTVRHRGSGLVCTFTDDYAGNQIHLFDTPSLRGQDVGCTSTNGKIRISVYATRYLEPKTAEQALRDSIAEVKQVYPDLKPWEGSRVSMEVDASVIPQRYVTDFQMRWRSELMYSSTQTAEHRGWIFKIRATGPVDDAAKVQIESGAKFLLVLMRVKEAPGDVADPPPA